MRHISDRKSWHLIAGRMALLLIVAAFADPARAWGNTAHRVMADIAAKNLEPEVAARVRELLEGKSMADVASLPDDWRVDQPETSGYHFLIIPVGEKYDEARDCPVHDCAIGAIERFRYLLADRMQSPKARQRALIYLIHIVGDIHQPFHVASRIGPAGPDLGGNRVRITFFGTATSLHAIWDSRMVDASGESATDRAKRLRELEVPPKATEGTVVDWVNDASQLAMRLYVNDGATLGQAYSEQWMPVLDRQLLLGGVRLARLLNETLGSH